MSFFLNFIITFFKRKKWLLVTLLIGLIIFSAAGYYLYRLNNRDHVIEGIVGTHEERDMPDNVLNLISKPLIKVDKSGSPSAELAESWESNPEANLYKVKLKPNLKWTDGTPVKASEIYISIPDVEITAPDDSTLEFKLAATFSPFPGLLTKPILRKANAEFGMELVGVGPYKIESLTKNGPFVKKLKLLALDENLPKVELIFYPDEGIAKTEFKLGNVQALLGFSDTKDLDFNNIARKGFTNYRQIVTIFLNTKDPLLSDDNLRLALAYGAPEIEGEEVAKTSLSPHSWAFNPNVKDYLNNNDKAKEALGKVEKGKEETITLTTACCLGEIGEQVINSWSELGLKAVLREESGTPQNFQALLITQDIPADPDQYILWHSLKKDSTNISRIESPRIDKDLEDGRQLTNPEQRKQKYQDFQRVLLDEAPAIFLYFPKYEVVYMKKVESNLSKVLQIQLSNLN